METRITAGTVDSMYCEAEYRYADIGHAIDTARPNTDVRIVEFTKESHVAILNQFLAGKWRQCAGNLVME